MYLCFFLASRNEMHRSVVVSFLELDAAEVQAKNKEWEAIQDEVPLPEQLKQDGDQKGCVDVLEHQLARVIQRNGDVVFPEEEQAKHDPKQPQLGSDSKEHA